MGCPGIQWKNPSRNETIDIKRPGRVSIGRFLSRGVAEDLLTIGIESQVEKTDTLHETLGLVKLALTAEESLDELDTGVLAEGSTLLVSLEHGGLASFEELAELVSQALARVNEVIENLLVLSAADAVNSLIRTLDLACELDKKEPELTSHVGDGSGRAVVEDSPVVDPLAKGVGVEDTAQQEDWLLSGIPVLERVTRGDLVPLGISIGGLANGRGLLLLGRGAGGRGSLRDIRRGAAGMGVGRGGT